MLPSPSGGNDSAQSFRMFGNTAIWLVPISKALPHPYPYDSAQQWSEVINSRESDLIHRIIHYSGNNTNLQLSIPEVTVCSPIFATKLTTDWILSSLQYTVWNIHKLNSLPFQLLPPVLQNRQRAQHKERPMHFKASSCVCQQSDGLQ